MDFYELAKVLFGRKELRAFQVCDGGNSILVEIKARIELYDRDALDKLINSGRLSDEDAQTLSHLSDYAQEHRFKITRNDDYNDFFSYSVELLRHDPFNAFGSPFCDIGPFAVEIRRHIQQNDYDALVNALIDEVRFINVMDIAVMRRFLHYTHDYNHKSEL